MAANTPPLPPGFVLDQPEAAPALPSAGSSIQGAPPLPAGFQLEAPQPLRHEDGRLTEAGWAAEIAATKARRQQDIDNDSFLSNAVAGFGRAAPTAYQGVKQLLTEQLAGRTDKLASIAEALGVPRSDEVRKELADYFAGKIEAQRAATEQERRDSAGLTGTWGGTLGNLAGDVALTLPAGGLGLGARGVNAYRAVAQAGLAGGAQGYVQPVAAEGERVRNTSLGAAFGGGLSGLGRVGMRVAEEVIPANFTSRALNYFGGRANQQPFAQEGEALAQRTGIDLTPAMVSGSRAQTGAENMARQSLFSADTAHQADERIANQAIDYVNRVMDRISPDSVSPQAIGDRVQRTVREAVEKIADSREQTAAKQFGAIRAMVGDQPIVTYDNTKKVLQDIIAENTDVIGADAAKVRTQAQALLDEIAKKDGYSLDAARRARSAYGKAARGSENVFADVAADKNRALASRMYGAMSADLDAAGSRLDEAAGFGSNMPVPEGVQVNRPSDMLRQANADYRRHSDLLKAVEMSPLKRLLGDQINVDDFMTVNTLPPETVIQRIGSMKPSELSQVASFMEKNAPDTWQQYKRLLVEDALSQAQTFPASAGAKTLPFNAPNFIKALGGNSPDQVKRLEQIYAPGEMDQLMDAIQAARRMGDKFGTNYSGTGPYNEIMQSLRNFSVQGLATTASSAAGFQRVARMMLNSDGRRALIELAKVPPGTKRANDLAAYLASVSAVNAESDKPLEIDIVGGRRMSEADQAR